MSVSNVFMNADFKYVSRISLSPKPFSLHQKAQAYILVTGGP